LVESQALSIIVSIQVLGELCNVLIRKTTFSQSETQAAVLDLVNTFSVLAIDTSTVLNALEIEIHARYGYSYWDSLIIATALQSDCSILYSEDMQHDQLIEGRLRIINPLI
jgi:predicted nucleic acid-binding protein